MTMHAHGKHRHSPAKDSAKGGAKSATPKAAVGANEEMVRAILAKSKQPMSAYDILPEMAKKLGRPVAPPTVYRALQHLESEGLVSRIESKNAYILCCHPHEKHDCLFFICRKCGKATEAPDPGISKRLRKEAQTLGFAASKQILEILGVCEDCSRA
jgi:Fur family zinc uptake transcriptional regulator